MEDVCLSKQNCAQLSDSNCELNRKETFIVNKSTNHDITPAKNINKNNQSNESINNSEKQPLEGAEDVLAGSQISSGNFDDEFCENLDGADEEDNGLDCEINTIKTTNNFITMVNENIEIQSDKSDFKDDTFLEEKIDNICREETANSRSTNANYLARALKRRSIRW